MLKIVVQMGIFLICAQSIIHLRPKKEYEKYLKYLLSLMIFLQILLPLKEIALLWKWDFTIESSADYQERLERYMEDVAMHIYESNLSFGETENEDGEITIEGEENDIEGEEIDIEGGTVAIEGW